MFKVGDRVFSPFHNYGTIVGIDETDRSYPITVQWDESRYKLGIDLSTFTEDGYLFFGNKTENTKITKVEGEEKVGQIAGVINYDIGKKMAADEEKRSVEGKKFKVGDRVWSPYFGGGTVTNTETVVGDAFPITVHWDDAHLSDYDCFTEDGKYTADGGKPEMGIYHIDPEAAAKSLPNIMKELAEEDNKDESTVERMEDALSKKVDDAINPSHYKVEGLPEAIDIINHLMHREQYEGFLWGNILKYAYRFGRKGDKAETAGKIAWYANQLKDLEEEKRK